MFTPLPWLVTTQYRELEVEEIRFPALSYASACTLRIGLSPAGGVHWKVHGCW